jgi:hypothetical protein
VLSYTYTDPLKEADPALVETPGTWQP